MVFYLKYRPQKLSDLDLVKVRGRLMTVASAGRIPHAFLFAGPKGTGKTSAARIIAKIINCQKLETRNLKLEDNKTSERIKNPKVEPCNSCDMCKSITNGSNLDVMEIDAASNRGIDEIRKLREGIKLTPVEAPAKVYIIDEVHMLTAEAFNALLKTIEEPPDHAYFILATTEPRKLPETIVSRCFLVEFDRASEKEIVHALRRVVKGEKLNVEQQALHLISQYADGAFRDAVKILEEVSVETAAITVKQVQQVLGTITDAEKSLISYLANGQVDKSLAFIQGLASRGTNFPIFTKRVINDLHKGLLAHYGVVRDKGVPLEVSQLIRLMRLLSRAVVEARHAPIAQLPLEMAIVEWCEEEVGSGKLEVGSEKLESRKERKVARSRKGNEDGELIDFHSRLIAAVKPHNHSVAGILRGCSQLTIDSDTVIIKTPYQFHYERLRERKVRELLEDTASEILGRTVVVETELAKND